MKVLGFGDCCVDYYIEEQMAYPGGNAFNVAVFAKENGADSGFLGTIGTDRIGEHIMACARERGIDISRCPVRDGASGKAAVHIIDGNRVFAGNYFNGEHGVGTLYPPVLSGEDMAYMKSFDLIHGSCYAHIEDQFCRLQDLGPLLSFDFSEEDKFRTEDYLGRLAPVLDFALFSCEHLTDAAIGAFASSVMDMGCANVLATMGGRGQRLFTASGDIFEGRAKHITATDTMGAGDSFCAALLTGLLKRGWKKNVRVTETMAVPALAEAAAYSARNCLVRGSFGSGLKIAM
ncbi:MAG TPA: ribokinase [Candidatus Scybalocola faecipullorum]|nr:ribokinase [Candidatus Scybalocola faecipullorum]